MPDAIVEQALYGSRDAGGYRFLARSPGFRDEWLSEAEQLCTGFGERLAADGWPPRRELAEVHPGAGVSEPFLCHGLPHPAPERPVRCG